MLNVSATNGSHQTHNLYAALVDRDFTKAILWLSELLEPRTPKHHLEGSAQCEARLNHKAALNPGQIYREPVMHFHLLPSLSPEHFTTTILVVITSSATRQFNV